MPVCGLWPGLYGAAQGNRGGFFTFGLEGGLRGRPFGALPVELEVGLFVGGGGGGQAPQGGGLMVRPHLGAALPLGRFRLGVELSRVRFPNGDIDSTQAALTLGLLTDHLWIPEGGWSPAYSGPVSWSDREIELAVRRVNPRETIRNRNGLRQQPFDLAGFSLTTDLQGPWFRFVSADGAAGGTSAGYAQAMAGVGLRLPLPGSLGMEARLGAGLGGGGNVDTGGGGLISGEGALTLGSARWKASLGLGFMRAPGGDFQGRTLTFRVSHRTRVPLPQTQGETLGAFDQADWRLGSGLQVYRMAPRYSSGDRQVQVLTLRADRLINHGFYFSGEAGSATGGGAGGYSAGLAGLGWETPCWAQQRLFAEAAMGAGAGGDLRSGGGLLASVRAGWRWELRGGLGVEATLGRIRAPRGDLNTTTYGLGLQWRFKAPER